MKKESSLVFRILARGAKDLGCEYEEKEGKLFLHFANPGTVVLGNGEGTGRELSSTEEAGARDILQLNSKWEREDDTLTIAQQKCYIVEVLTSART
ncbi:MAG: hypothetical protein CEN88_354 [Candidatus Berkelbacteria bacterium Licking1014_2]|uniref:Uncharacterized protein n=1 Tax=Candidatus Berkelbacteria bacterium Licking1014_2 TaxID=2017146 RepID=A0A554LU83_9BACT|nr:MAG: hypothetical protein CEN88_354 [Candidatus Berkelbacteria bacterium Licking1014_2]